MRFAISAPVLLVAIAALGLVSDRLPHAPSVTHTAPDAAGAAEVRHSLAIPGAQDVVNFQVPSRPFRLTVPGVASRVGDGGDPAPNPFDDLFYMVVVELEVFDAEPEACCLSKTQVQLRGGHFLPAATFSPQMQPVEGLWLEKNFTQHPMPDLEGCTWTRVFEPQAGPDLLLRWEGMDLWSLTVYNPNWFYRITGCPNLEGGADTRTRTVAEYLELLFQHSNPVLISAPTPPRNMFASCVVGYGELSGQAQYVEGRILLYIYRGGSCQVPLHDVFPF